MTPRTTSGQYTVVVSALGLAVLDIKSKMFSVRSICIIIGTIHQLFNVVRMLKGLSQDIELTKIAGLKRTSICITANVN